MVFTARRLCNACARRGMCYEAVCVCLSVTSRFSIETHKRIALIFGKEATLGLSYTTPWFIKTWQYIYDHNSGKAWWILMIVTCLETGMNALCK